MKDNIFWGGLLTTALGIAVKTSKSKQGGAAYKSKIVYVEGMIRPRKGPHGEFYNVAQDHHGTWGENFSERQVFEVKRKPGGLSGSNRIGDPNHYYEGAIKTSEAIAKPKNVITTTKPSWWR